METTSPLGAKKREKLIEHSSLVFLAVYTLQSAALSSLYHAFPPRQTTYSHCDPKHTFPQLTNTTAKEYLKLLSLLPPALGCLGCFCVPSHTVYIALVIEPRADACTECESMLPTELHCQPNIILLGHGTRGSECANTLGCIGNRQARRPHILFFSMFILGLFPREEREIPFEYVQQ